MYIGSITMLLLNMYRTKKHKCEFINVTSFNNIELFP